MSKIKISSVKGFFSLMVIIMLLLTAIVGFVTYRMSLAWDEINSTTNNPLIPTIINISIMLLVTIGAGYMELGIESDIIENRKDLIEEMFSRYQ